MKRIRSVTVRGRRWPVRWVTLPHEWGLCSKHDHVIELDATITDPATYATILMHEMLHGQLPDFDEDAVTQIADELTIALQRAKLLAEDD